MMLEFLGWGEAAKLIEDGIARTIQQKRVTYDLERLMPNATKSERRHLLRQLLRIWRAGRRTVIKPD